jgi:hypothetical protein
MTQSNHRLRSDKIILAGFTGTSFMTLFSYLVSEVQEENFKEPELLGKLLQTLAPDVNKDLGRFIGWNLHYFVGFIFAFLYASLWERTKVRPTLKSGLILGALSGMVGLTVWKLCFRVHPNPPKINFKRYYGHLLATHLIFGVFTVIGYNLSNARRNKHVER